MPDWESVNFIYSMTLDSYSYFHLLAFNLYYDTSSEKGKSCFPDSTRPELECMKLLLNQPQIIQGININSKDRLGATCLHYLACMRDVVDIFKLFVEKGADLTLKDKEENYIIHYAIRHHNVSIYLSYF